MILAPSQAQRIPRRGNGSSEWTQFSPRMMDVILKMLGFTLKMNDFIGESQSRPHRAGSRGPSKVCVCQHVARAIRHHWHWQAGPWSVGQNDESCSKNDELCIQNDDFCVQGTGPGWPTYPDSDLRQAHN